LRCLAGCRLACCVRVCAYPYSVAELEQIRWWCILHCGYNDLLWEYKYGEKLALSTVILILRKCGPTRILEHSSAPVHIHGWWSALLLLLCLLPCMYIPSFTYRPTHLPIYLIPLSQNKLHTR
jgi:hypothetical protein